MFQVVAWADAADGRPIILPSFSKIIKRQKTCIPLATLASIIDDRGCFQPQEPAMQSDDLTPAQAEKLKTSPAPMLAYVNRLKKRMEKRRFPNDDRLYLSVLKAYDAIHELNVHVHYLSCESGVGQKCRRGKRKTSWRPPSTSCVP